MEKHNVSIFVPNLNQNNRWHVPVVWAYLKTYYDYKGKYPEKFNWILPRMDPQDDYGIKEDLLNNPPTVFGFSGYIWNINQCYRISQWVKEQFPDCLIVSGGPQAEYQWDNSYFKKHPYLDIVIPFDGEFPFTDILDTVAEGRSDWENCADLILPPRTEDLLRGWSQSYKTIPRKEFEFPPSAFLHCNEELEILINEAVSKGHEIGSLMELNRGCPYKCTFCDWGGGTYTKIRKKPQEIIGQELEWCANHPIDYLTFTDANLGVFREDVENIRQLVDLGKKTGWPKLVRFSNAKNNKDRVQEIYLLLARAGMTDSYKHAFQDTDGEVKEIIQRKDISWEESLEVARAINKEGFESKLQMIFGLPGQSWKTFLSNMDYIMGEDLFDWPRFYPFILLPNSPAADPAYREKYKMKFVERAMETEVCRLRKDISLDEFHSTANYVVDDYEQQKSWYVVETSTYSREDYIHLLTFSNILISLHTLGMTKLIADYLNREYGIKYSEFYEGIYHNFLTGTDFVDHWVGHLRKWASDNTDNSYPETCPAYDDEDIPWEFSPMMYFQWHFFYRKNWFYEYLTEYLDEKYVGEENKIPELSSLVSYCKNTLIDFDHRLYYSDGKTQRRKIFPSRYNWKEYFEGAELEQGDFEYEIHDTTVSYGVNKPAYPIDWQEADTLKERKIQFIYRVVYGRQVSGRYKEIERVNPDQAR